LGVLAGRRRQNTPFSVVCAAEMPMKNQITIVGLGPGDPALLTRQAWDFISTASEIYPRTRHHPAVSGFPAGIKLHSFDELYENADTFEIVYAHIVQQVLELGRRPQGVIYAVPGHPYIAEATVPAISRLARQAGMQVSVIEGLSFLEPTLSLLGLDPFPHTALVDAFELVTAHVPPFPPSAPAIIAQIHSRAMASDVKLTLMANYPDHHPVQLVHAAGTAQSKVESLSLYEIDRSDSIGLLTSLYIPAMDASTSFEAFQEVIAHLRAPDGCPWDREQTHATLRSHLLEEAYEVVTALDADDPAAMREEFGDLLLQIVLHAQIASEFGEFSMADILQGIHVKIVNRHPHVFGDLFLKDVDGVLQNWEKLKAAERAANGKAEVGLLDGVPLALPALAQADQYQRRAARVGFDWTGIEGVLDKVSEELDEVRSAPDEASRGQELGDLFFALVNLTRWVDMDAETLLREANARFRWRFSQIEAAARSQGRAITDLTLDEMEALWQAAKRSSAIPPGG
jgi:tetrapyrrole methylase family protein/MazG family protein